MITSRSIALTVLLLVLGLTTACLPGSAETSIAQAPEVFVFPAETDPRLISTEDIPLNNCDGSAEASQTVERSHTVLRTLELGTGITVDADGRAGIPGIGEVGVGAAVATHYKVSYGSQDTVSRAVTVAAKEGTNILHTIRQYEIWETGEILISAGGENQRISFSFRKDFSMEALPPANLGCPGPGTQPLLPTSGPDVASDQLQEQSSPTAREVVATQQPPPTETPLQPTPNAQTIPRFEVQSTVIKNRTGLAVTTGDIIHVEYLDGEWTGDSAAPGRTNGCGFRWDDPDPNRVWLFPPEQRGAALVGYIDGTPFFVGCQPVNITAPASGELYLGMSECQNCYWDNDGSLFVLVSVRKP